MRAVLLRKTRAHDNMNMFEDILAEKRTKKKALKRNGGLFLLLMMFKSE